MTILLLETATSVCSVVLESNGQTVAWRTCDEPNAHSTKLAVFVGEVISEAGMSMNQLDAVCVSAGPGSYTGLRIGVSAAKGLCYALEKPLLSVPTLQSMVAHYYQQHPDYAGLVCPMIDARRMECYTAVFNSQLEPLKETTADIIEPHIYDAFLDGNTVTFIGDGAMKTQDILGVHPNARYDAAFTISAAGMLSLAEQKLQDGNHEDVAYFEPFYLKDFIAKKSVVKGLRL